MNGSRVVFAASITLALAACASQVQPGTHAASTAAVESLKTQDKAKDKHKKPVWNDEFNGRKLDLSKWSHQIGNGFLSGDQYVAGWGNNELQYYTDRPENVKVEKGHLVITARKENYTGDANGTAQTFPWTSARIRTAGKFSRTYGKFEFRAKLPTGKGYWPALWMLPEDQPGNPYGTWAANGEIDIMESWGSKPTLIGQTLHYGGMWPNNVYTGEEITLPEGQTVTDWHTYAVEWTPGEINWYIDGKLTSTQKAWWSSTAMPPSSDADLAPWPAPFDKPFHLLINLAVGGNFDGNPDATTPDSGQMLIDYVRVYSLPDENRDPGPRPDMKYPWTPVPARDALPDGNLVYNGSFDWTAQHERVTSEATTLPGVPDSYFWTLYQSDGQAALSNDGGALKVDISQPGSVNYAVQIRQDGLNIVNGKRYEVTFDTWANSARGAMIKVGGGPNRGYAAYSGEQQVSIGTTRQTKTLTFDMTATSDAEARLEFNLGATGSGPVWIDNVRVKAVGDANTSARPPTSDGNYLYNANFTITDDADEGIPGVSGTDYWRTWNNPTTGLSVTTENGHLKLAVTNVDPLNNWHVQLNQPGVPLEQGGSYTLTFKGRSDTPRTVGVVIGENGGSYARYLDASAELTSTEQTYTHTFTASATNPLAQLQILGADGTAGDSYTLDFSDFRLTRNP